ncbi:MAG TPA: transcriptional regulator [Polyangia bacterium]
MDIRPIRNQRDHAQALREVERLWGAPIDAIGFRMEQMGLTRNDLIDIIGSRARVSEVLNRKRPLTVAMIVRLREELGISADILIGPHRRAA